MNLVKEERRPEMAEEIETTEEARPGFRRIVTSVKTHWKKWWAIAAAAVVVLGLGLFGAWALGLFGGDAEAQEAEDNTPIPNQPPPAPVETEEGEEPSKVVSVTEADLAKVNGRIDSVETDVTGLQKVVDGQGERLNKLSKTVDGHEERLGQHDKVLKQHDRRISANKQAIDECCEDGDDCDDDNNGQAKVPTPTPRPTPTSEPPTPSKAPTPVAEEEPSNQPTKVAEAPTRRPRGRRDCIELTHFGGTHTTVCP